MCPAALGRLWFWERPVRVEETVQLFASSPFSSGWLSNNLPVSWVGGPSALAHPGVVQLSGFMWAELWLS